MPSHVLQIMVVVILVYGGWVVDGKANNTNGAYETGYLPCLLQATIYMVTVKIIMPAIL